jgi:SOS response regulatory protein OraA/RecX
LSTRSDDPLSAALAALGRRERSVAEMTAWLEQRGEPSHGVEATVARLIELGALDDGRFARRYAADKREIGGWGSERIRDALEARQIAPELIAAVLSESDEDEVDRAAELLACRSESLADDASRGRAFGFLTRRGYAPETAYEAIRIATRRAA